MRVIVAVTVLLALGACSAPDVTSPGHGPANRSATILPGAEVIDLGTLGGAESTASGVNDAGTVVGYSSISGTRNQRAFMWTNGVMTDLGALPIGAGAFSIAYSVNNSGQAVGYSVAGFGIVHAVLWEGGTVQDLGGLEGDGSYSIARDVNDVGQIVGASVTTSGGAHGFLWQQGTMHDLGTLPGGFASQATAINASGQVVGFSGNATGFTHAVLWHNGVIRDLGTLGGFGSYARAINNAGQVVGESFTATGEYHAFLWQDGTMQDLGSLPHSPNSVAMGINELGQVVGQTERGAFFWSASDGMEDLSAMTGFRIAASIRGRTVVGTLQNGHAGLANVTFAPLQR